MRPLHDLIMDIERVRLATLFRLLLQTGIARKDVLYCNTDCLAFNPRKRKAKALDIAETTFADLKKPKHLAPCGLTSTDSTEKVFRAEET